MLILEKKKETLTIHGLMRYLMDFENEIIDPIKYELNDDMEQVILLQIKYNLFNFSKYFHKNIISLLYSAHVALFY